MPRWFIYRYPIFPQVPGRSQIYTGQRKLEGKAKKRGMQFLSTTTDKRREPMRGLANYSHSSVPFFAF